MKRLLKLQELDMKIARCKGREREIPKQKDKFKIHRDRLAAELEESEKACKDLAVEQRGCEMDIEQHQAQIVKYENQLLGVKKNDEYQALLHEIDHLKKQIGQREERIIAIMMEMDEAKARLEEDKTRIAAEVAEIDKQCAEIDAELAEAVKAREALEAERRPVEEAVPEDPLAHYKRLRQTKRPFPVVVPLNDEVCSGCNMTIRAQTVNEVLAGEKLLVCQHCGRILYARPNTEEVEEA